MGKLKRETGGDKGAVGPPGGLFLFLLILIFLYSSFEEED
jgi:hypothetical protein